MTKMSPRQASHLYITNNSTSTENGRDLTTVEVGNSLKAPLRLKPAQRSRLAILVSEDIDLQYLT